MNTTDLSVLKKRESLSEILVLPCSKSMKKRYEQLKNELHRRELQKLHDLSRKEIESMLDRVELLLSSSAS